MTSWLSVCILSQPLPRRGRTVRRYNELLTKLSWDTCPHYLLETSEISAVLIYCGAVGWGTALQTGRSRVRFPMVSLEFFIDIIFPAALWPTFADRGMSRGQRNGSPRPLISVFWTGAATFYSSSSSIDLMRLSGPRSRPTTTHKIW